MLRGMFRLIVVVAVLAAGAYLVGYRPDGWTGRLERASDAGVRTAEAVADTIDSDRIRQAGTEIGHTVAEGADRAQAALAEARLTAKIKSKIALDDTLGGSRIDVDTDGTVVTVSGTVEKSSQRERALQLAGETDSVTSVVDRLTVED